jgi:hypothetical protein
MENSQGNQGEPVAFIRHHPNGNKELVWSMDWRFDRQDHTALYLSAPTIPAGWQLVPKEPTPEMIAAACDCQDADPEDGCESEIYHGYRAMLSAAHEYKGPQP